MRFLANENFPLPSIVMLRLHFDVISVAENWPGISDEEVIRKALDETLIILTFDRDYGEIIYKKRVPFPPSVIYFRFKGKDPKTAGKLLLYLIESGSIQFENFFTVIEEAGVRQRIYVS